MYSFIMAKYYWCIIIRDYAVTEFWSTIDSLVCDPVCAIIISILKQYALFCILAKYI